MKKMDSLIDPAHPISRFVAEASRLAEALPFSRLLPGEAQKLGGYIYPDAPLLVEALIWALRDRPQLFPGLASRAEELATRLGQALLWDTLIARHELWLKQARESQVKDMGRLIKDTLGIMARIDLEDRLWADSLTQEQRRDPAWRQGDLLRWLERQMMLGPVRRLLERRRAMSRKGKPKSGGKKKSTVPGREMARALIDRVFGEGPKRG